MTRQEKTREEKTREEKRREEKRREEKRKASKFVGNFQMSLSDRKKMRGHY